VIVVVVGWNSGRNLFVNSEGALPSNRITGPPHSGVKRSKITIHPAFNMTFHFSKQRFLVQKISSRRCKSEHTPITKCM
jgi:hypothetical protein